MTIAFERLSAGVETAPIYEGLPDDACQSPHWGYLISGPPAHRVDRRHRGHPHAGQAYYLPPGHNVVVEEDTLVVEFSPPRTTARPRWTTPRR